MIQNSVLSEGEGNDHGFGTWIELFHFVSIMFQFIIEYGNMEFSEYGNMEFSENAV